MSSGDEPTTNDSESGVSNRLSFIEAISYTAFIGFIGAMAAGLFDGMVPWK
jgi:hypothetical protein